MGLITAYNSSIDNNGFLLAYLRFARNISFRCRRMKRCSLNCNIRRRLGKECCARKDTTLTDDRRWHLERSPAAGSSTGGAIESQVQIAV